MTTSAGTAPTDVRGILETKLSDADIDTILDDAEFDATQANDINAMSTTEVQQLEKYLAALKIVQSKDPRVTSERIGDAQFTYDGSTVTWLRREVNRRDPSGTLAYNRDVSRTVKRTGSN